MDTDNIKVMAQAGAEGGGSGASYILEITAPAEQVTGTKAEVATALGITEQDIDDILGGNILAVKTTLTIEGVDVTFTIPIYNCMEMELEGVKQASAGYLSHIEGGNSVVAQIGMNGDSFIAGVQYQKAG